VAGYDQGVFDLDAGRVCLDFANTLSSTSGEHLDAYADLVAFAAESGLLTPEDAAWLRDEGERHRPTADRVLARARRLRDAMYAIFSSIAAGKPPNEDHLALLNGELAATLQHARVEADPTSDGYRWTWSGRNLDAPLGGITRSAADVLTSPEDLRRVRECGGLDCRWLFLDTSKNRSRQWCSMQSCGNRHKARRHYQRLRAARHRVVKHTLEA
jgi:predicted RNA-binding Zn ribbon-like protein